MTMGCSCGGMIMGLHALITRLFPTTHSKEMDEQLLAEQVKQTRASKAALVANPVGSQTSEVEVEEEPVKKERLSLREVVVFLAKSPHMRLALPHRIPLTNIAQKLELLEKSTSTQFI
jgi:hypothetical protein